MGSNKKPFIIGITGAFGSGKSTASQFFASKGFTKIVLSSFLEKEAKKKGINNAARKILQDIGNQWRETFGKGILAKKAIALLQKDGVEKAVIDGIRNIGEIEVLRKKSRFVLLGIVADRIVRFKRLKNLKRREPLTFETFFQLDARDLGLGEKDTGLQVGMCIAFSDVFIDNNRGTDVFYGKLEQFLKEKDI